MIRKRSRSKSSTVEGKRSHLVFGDDERGRAVVGFETLVWGGGRPMSNIRFWRTVPTRGSFRLVSRSSLQATGTEPGQRLDYLGRFEMGSRVRGTEASQLTRSSSKTPLRIFTRMSLAACSKASSTFSPERALVSTNNKPSSFAHISASSDCTSRFRLAGPASSEHRSVLLPTKMHVRCGSACWRTSLSHVRAFEKP